MTQTSTASTTHTLEMDQVAALNEHLTRRRHAPLTAGELRVDGVPGQAVLQRVSASGPPCFPWVFGHFSVSGDQEVSAELHTGSLERLSDSFHLHQRWGL
ncbi:hypothetical protein KIH74_23895 [Kineosporia sp. J2-2]|uniref:Uncharacterized protein n=1 Tax=Kineosporia corallincola TaxID=2835133 RepID=A0ABS5TLM5_9ACTN|nr:hypothetical protein [Kineosporia corallincola]MBT0772006.1 hypothetical protein [Kineosporia corallincola]